MVHCMTRGGNDGLRLIGLAVSVIGLMTVMTRLVEQPAGSPPFSSERIAHPVASSPSTTPRIHLGARDTVSPDSVGRHKRGGQGDARRDLRDAAIMARWYLWTGPGGRETRTELWINAPASIGSTSPPESSPAIRFPEE